MRRMQRIALALLVAAAALYALATVLHDRHPAWPWVAAFAEAAMVGAIADWFAVVALFRHPLGLPIPHTAIVPRNKRRIGENLAAFLQTHFLAAPWVLERLRAVQPASRLADWLARPGQADRLGALGAAAAQAVLQAIDREAVQRLLRDEALAALARVEPAPLAARALALLTQEGRHHPLLDSLLGRLAVLLEGDAVQEHVADAVAREVKALRYLGLDQVAARLLARKIVAAAARTAADMAGTPDHPLRARFDSAVAEAVARLQQDAGWAARTAAARDALLADPALRGWLDAALASLLDGLMADPSAAGGNAPRMARLAEGLGRRLGSDPALRSQLDAQLLAAVPALLARWNGPLARYVVARIDAWDTDDLARELERAIGRDLQFIRINGTLVGGAVGLLLHAVGHAIR